MSLLVLPTWGNHTFRGSFATFHNNVLDWDQLLCLFKAEYRAPEDRRRTWTAPLWGTACSQTRGLTWQGS